MSKRYFRSWFILFRSVCFSLLPRQAGVQLKLASEDRNKKTGGRVGVDG